MTTMNDEHARVRRQLRRAAWTIGAYGEWVDACRAARHAGWSQAEVERELNSVNARQFLIAVLLLLSLVAVGMVVTPSSCLHDD